MCRKVMALLAIVLIFSSASLFAETGDGLPVAKTKVRTLAAFKNGLSFVFKSGVTPLKDGWAVLEEMPSASLGALWIGTGTSGARVDEVVSYKGTIPGDTDAQSISEILDANAGNDVTVYWQGGVTSEPKKITGKLIAVPRIDRSDTQTDRGQYYQGQIVILQTADGTTVSINKSLIQYIEMSSGVKMKTKIDRVVTSAKAHVKGDPESADITVAYLGKGITWSPNYLINIQNEKEADVTLEAVLANDTEDLDNTEVSFVVGYPNFGFANVITPLSALQSVSAFIQALSGSASGSDRGSGGSRGAMSQSQSIMYNYAQYPGSPSSAWSPDTSYTASNLPGESNEDLFFYKHKSITLKKGERGRYTIFSIKAPYTHLYQWDIPDSMRIDDRGYRQGNDPSRDIEEQVWHVLEFNNTSQMPWTTGPAFVVNGPMPVAQDMMKYTPSKARNSLRLTVATDVRAEQAQTEISRENATVGVDTYYDNIKVDGTLVIRNLKSNEITLNITKAVTGEVLETGQDGKVTKNAKRLTAVNPQSEIVWKFPLAPGAEKTLTYKYKILVHR